jgi:hypothetical protein
MKKADVHAGAAITAVDLFCGAGGLTHGLIKGGIKVVAGIDLDKACRFPYEKNNSARFLERDIKDLPGSEIKELFAGAEVTLLAGCAPCQPFSTYSRSDRKRGGESEWDLVASFGRLVRESASFSLLRGSGPMTWLFRFRMGKKPKRCEKRSPASLVWRLARPIALTRSTLHAASAN